MLANRQTNTAVKRRILIIEDEADIANLVQLHLGEVCDEVSIAADGRDGLARATGEDWDLVVLDLRLPGIDGLDICRRLRAGQKLHAGADADGALDRVRSHRWVLRSAPTTT